MSHNYIEELKSVGRAFVLALALWLFTTVILIVSLYELQQRPEVKITCRSFESKKEMLQANTDHPEYGLDEDHDNTPCEHILYKK